MSTFVQIHAMPGQRFPQSFENLAALLSNLPGMYFEMDGSFVWVDHQSNHPHQMDGMVYDRDDRIEYIEVKGPCSLHQWQMLCQSACAVEFDPVGNYALIDTILRVHRVAQGDWTMPSELASQLMQRDAQE